jgi:GT2 family glycosyltransferase
VIDPGWLTEMAALAVRPDVGAVGAKLYFPDGRIQHAGVVLGLGPLKVAGHAFRGGPGDLGGPQDMLKVVREVSAVTAACLVVERAKFEAVGGFDGSFQVAFNDVDLCLRLNDRGWKTLWTPHARLVHLESASRGKEAAERKAARMAVETARMHERWGERLLSDPYFHPALVAERYALGRVKPPPVAR